MIYHYRQETPDDYEAVEVLTREAFWNVYKPGCDEHYIVHAMRGDPAVVEALNTVAVDEDDGVVGHIFWTRTRIALEDGGELSVLSFGPISVRPDAQGQGIGSALIHRTVEKARDIGAAAVVITGNPAYYHRFRFRPASDYDLVDEEGNSYPALMALELEEGRLANVRGRILFCPQFMKIDQEAVEAFDRRFPAKVKRRLPGQLG